MVARIGLLGGESTGKTALARALADALPACLVEEELRAFVDRNGRPPRRDEQAALLDAQRLAEEAVAAACPHPVLVADPAPLMTAVYSEVYFDDPSLTDAAADDATAYDLLVWCGDDVPWTGDGRQRDGEQYRAAADAVLARMVSQSLVPRGIRVIRVTGPVADRVESVLQAWQSDGGAGPT